MSTQYEAEGVTRGRVRGTLLLVCGGTGRWGSGCTLPGYTPASTPLHPGYVQNSGGRTAEEALPPWEGRTAMTSDSYYVLVLVHGMDSSRDSSLDSS